MPLKLDLSTYLDDRKVAVEHALRDALPSPETPPTLLHQAMQYSLLAGGKRIRPILALAACEAVGGDPDRILPLVLSLEFIHTYSLIHDDLPSMDDDDLRRGQPTNHRVYGEDVAILAGDALHALAFARLADPAVCPELDSAVRLAAVYELASAAGYLGLVGGQVMDLRTAPPPTTLDERAHEGGRSLDIVEGIHVRKTGALIRAAVRIGAILGDATTTQHDALSRYGEAVGLAFQITDDLLDLDGSPEELGKATGKDHDQRKWTYPGVVGAPRSRVIAETCVQSALNALSTFDSRAEALRGIARYLLDRRA